MKRGPEKGYKRTDIVDADHLPDGERLPHRVKNEMELERQGKWNLIGGSEGLSNDTLQQAAIASEKADEFDASKHEVPGPKIVIFRSSMSNKLPLCSCI